MTSIRDIAVARPYELGAIRNCERVECLIDKIADDSMLERPSPLEPRETNELDVCRGLFSLRVSSFELVTDYRDRNGVTIRLLSVLTRINR